MGPADYNILKTYGHNFDEIVEFGNFLGLKFLIRLISLYLLLPLFNMLHAFIPNYGVVIIVFSLIIKAILVPAYQVKFSINEKDAVISAEDNRTERKI